MPLHKRYAQQLGHEDVIYSVVKVEGIACVYDITLQNKEWQRNGMPKAVNFNELIEKGLLTGDLISVTKQTESDSDWPFLSVLMRTGIDKTKSYSFRAVRLCTGLTIAPTNMLMNEVLDKIVDETTKRIEQVQQYTVFGEGLGR